MELRELLINEQEELFGVEAISLVEYPAIQENFVFFSENAPQGVVLAKVDEERRTIVGPALIPHKHIYRRDPDGLEYNVFFSPKTVQQAAHLFLRQSKTHAATVEHRSPIDGVFVQESWIVEEPGTDKQQLYGFNLPSGTWMVSMKVENDKMWEGIKDGSLRGLSIEGWFVDKIEKLKTTDMSKQDKGLVERMKGWFSAKPELLGEAKLQDGGSLVTEEDMAVGVMAYVMSPEGEMMEAEPGTYTLEDGSTVVVGEGAIIESMGEEEEATEDFTDSQLTKIGEIVAGALKDAGITELSAQIKEQGEALETAKTELSEANKACEELKAKLEKLGKAKAAEHILKETTKTTGGSIRSLSQSLRK